MEKENTFEKMSPEELKTIKASLKKDKDGKRPIQCLGNYATILSKDRNFDVLRFNALSSRQECCYAEIVWPVDDLQVNKWQLYIERTYGLTPKDDLFNKALSIQCARKTVNPIKKIIEAAQWDGEKHIETILQKWLKCEDTPFTREVARLIFAGGINRLYNPGCKFDYFPVLIGTNQGEGKSTFTKWLSLDDSFYRTLNVIGDSKIVYEHIRGGWIVELPELLALKKTKDEQSKMFFSADSDQFRVAYGRREQFVKRPFVFIGTTNEKEFLHDKTGNRRYLPIEVHSKGRELFDCEQDVRKDILQCWAEALYHYKTKTGYMNPVENIDLETEIKSAQTMAEDDDYRVGLIEAYLKDCRYTRTPREKDGKQFFDYGRKQADSVCLPEVVECCLGKDRRSATAKETREIAQILRKLGWDTIPGVNGNKREYFNSIYDNHSGYFRSYGQQMAFYRPSDEPETRTN